MNSALIDSVLCYKATLVLDAIQDTNGVSVNSGHIQLPPDEYFQNEDFTILAYVYLTTTSSFWGSICDFGNGKYDENVMMGFIYDEPYFQIVNGDSMMNAFVSITSSIPAPPDQWSHIAANFISANQTMSLYVNGALGFTSPVYVPKKAMRYFNYIGNNNWDEKSYLKIKGFKIYKKALSIDEIQADMQSYN